MHGMDWNGSERWLQLEDLGYPLCVLMIYLFDLWIRELRYRAIIYRASALRFVCLSLLSISRIPQLRSRKTTNNHVYVTAALKRLKQCSCVSGSG